MFKKRKNTDRFQMSYIQGSNTPSNHFEIWVDTVTGVNYLYHISAGGFAGLTVMLDENGKPVVTHEDLSSQ